VGGAADAYDDEGVARALAQAETVIEAMAAGGAQAGLISALALPSDAPERLRFVASSVSRTDASGADVDDEESDEDSDEGEAGEDGGASEDGDDAQTEGN
ncbi:MAG: hypothetical protein JJU18_04820, partial [Oceanicaulis sp.]|nr:hypothetical protein [Oceanicaulis sp.]